MQKEKFISIAKLIKTIANGEAKSDQLETALAQLTKDDNIDAVHTLNIGNGEGKYTLLECAIEMYMDRVSDKSKTDALYQVIESLIKHAANINLKNTEGKSYLHQISQPSLQPKMLRYEARLNAVTNLLTLFYKNHADFNNQDSIGNTALHTAAKARNYGLIETLHDFGCGLNIPNKSTANSNGTPATAYDLVKTNKESESYLDLVKQLGGISYNELSAIIVDRRYKLVSLQENDYSAYQLVQDRQFELLGEKCNHIDLTTLNKEGESCLDVARKNGSLAELFSHDRIKAAIQSQFPHAEIRKCLTEIEEQTKAAELPQKTAQAEKIEAAPEEEKSPVMKSLLTSFSTFSIKENGDISFIAKLKVDCLLNKQENFVKHSLEFLLASENKETTLLEIISMTFALPRPKATHKVFTDALVAKLLEFDPEATKNSAFTFSK